jgi:hypothetical protein
MPACTLSGEIDEIAALMPPDACSVLESDDEADEPDAVDDGVDEEPDDGVDEVPDDGVDDWLDDEAPRPLLPSEPLLPAAELRLDEDEDDDGLLLPRLPLDDAFCRLDDDGDELVLLRFDEALCWLPDEAVVPLFRLESWLLPMFEPDLLASMPLPSLDF